MEDVDDEKKSLLDICKMMDKMNGIISDLGEKLSSRMDTLEGKFESFVDQKMSALDETLSDKIEAVERALNEIKESKPTVVPNDATSNNNEDDEANSKELSWMVEMKQTSQDEFPVQRVVKKVYNVSNKKKKESNISDDLSLCEKKVFTKGHENENQKKKKCGPKDEKKKAKVVVDSPTNKKKKKIMPDQVVGDVEDITDQVRAENTKMASSSEETWVYQGQQLASKRLTESLTSLGEAMKLLDGGATQGRRVPYLAESQKYPYVGNSTVKRIITDAVPSNVVYDVFQPAEDDKFRKLTDFLQLDTFYWQIMTPRTDWPTGDYGWLKDYHMGAAMTMFRQRFMCAPSQYPNQRITFLDQDFITTLHKDFPQFEPSHKNFLFRDCYVNQFNGIPPIGPATNKKWYVDVDHLYACLFVNGNHWVALDINLLTRKIYVYDSIPTLVRDAELVLHCLFLRRMIPALLSQEIPDEVRKKSYAMLDVRRVKVNVPLNEDPGDCGVFALKYIECLALGKPFDGLCDRNIPALRVKLATELFDEVGEEYGHHISQNRKCAKDFVIPHLTDSP